MRLVCPNCGAQYEVDDRVIPESGRDVQCSACGHAWYQMPHGHAEPPEIAPPPEDDAESQAEWEAAEADLEAPEAPTEPEPMAEPEAAFEPEPEGELRPEPEPDEAADEDEPPAPTPPTARRAIDETVRGILQEEARHELARREVEPGQEPGAVETQPDLGLDDGASAEEERRRIARERMARMRGLDSGEDDLAAGFDAPEPPPEQTPEPPEAGPAGRPHESSAARRDLFPDIEEINSTLDSRGSAGGGQAGADDRERSSGFARGFFLVVLLAVLATTLYILAPTLAARIPALEPALAAYVGLINEGRAWLDEALKGLITKIEAKVQAGQ